MAGFEAYDVHSLLDNTNWLPVDQDKHLDRFGFPLSDEEIMTFRCHVSLWQKFILSNKPFCLIVEDNITLNDEQIEGINECILGISDGWDVFFPYEREDILGTFNEIKILNPTRHEKYDPQPYLLGYEWGNSIYALTRDGAYRLLREIRSIEFRLDDSILELAVDKKARVLFSKIDFFDIMDFSKRRNPGRDRLIEEAVFNFNLWNKEDEADLRHLLKSISEIAKKYNIKLILQGGTHLGYVRHGGKMPWDDDVDLGIHEEDFSVFRKELDESNLKYDRYIEGSTGKEFYKIWLDNDRKVNGFSHCFPFVDLWLYNIVGKDLIFKNGIVCPNSANYPYQQIIFEEAEFCLVGNSLEVLDSRYIDWRTKIRIYNWNHKEENENRHKLSCSIEVDESGGLLENR